MTSKDNHQIALTLLQELQVELATVLDETRKIALSQSDISYTLATAEMMLIYQFDDSKFYLSFAAGNTAYQIVSLTFIILRIFETSELNLMSDFYLSKDPVELFFGDDAYEKQQNDILKKTGRAKCAVCELAYQTSYMRNGICLDCLAANKIVYH